MIDQWIQNDKTFASTKASDEVLSTISRHDYVTIIGGPGSGKTTISHHVALIYMQKGYQLVPVYKPTEIISYGNIKKRQIFLFDDTLGVFGVDHDKVNELEHRQEMLLSTFENGSKLIMTCRKSVFRATEMICVSQSTKAFFLQNYVDLENNQICLNENEKRSILLKHCLQSGLDQSIFTSWSFESANIMFPFLCHLFANDKKYQDIGFRFFNEPYECLYEKLDEMKHRSRTHYGALVMCMFNNGNLSEDNFPESAVKRIVYNKCRLNDGTPELDLLDALDHLLETYVTRCDDVFHFIHDSIFEVTASHFGNQYPNLIIQYLHSSYIAHNVRVMPDELSHCLYVYVGKQHYSSLANRIYSDITKMELYDVFMNKSLTFQPFLSVFLDLLGNKPYLEIKNIFLSIQKDNVSSDIVYRGEDVIEKVMSKDKFRDACVSRSQDMLVDKKVEADNSVGYNIRVLSWVIYYGHTLLLKHIIDMVLSKNESTDLIFGTTEAEQTRLLILACFGGNFDMLRLIKKYVNSNCINRAMLPTSANWSEKKRNPHRCKTPLTAACLRGDLASIEELLKIGAEVNKPDSLKLLPILAAACSCNCNAMELLIRNNADINKGNSNRTPPLLLTATVGHTDAAKLLLTFGATVNLCKNDGTSALYRASDKGHLKFLSVLVQEGGDINLCNHNGRSPLSIASENGHLEIVEFLIQKGAYVNTSDDGITSPLFPAGKTKTPLYFASSKGHVKVINYLFRHGANPDICDNQRQSPLLIATTNGHVAAVKELLDNGANVNLADENNISPLFLASQNTVLQELLLRYGADKKVTPFFKYKIRSNIKEWAIYYLGLLGLLCAWLFICY